jgi:hypothetical protein
VIAPDAGSITRRIEHHNRFNPLRSAFFMNACDPLVSENGALSSRKQLIFDWFRVMATAGLLVWLVYASGAGLGYNWQWYRVPRYLYTFSEGHFLAGPLLKGLVVTLQVSCRFAGTVQPFGPDYGGVPIVRILYRPGHCTDLPGG